MMYQNSNVFMNSTVLGTCRYAVVGSAYLFNYLNLLW